jgi:hypothetical protein
MDPAKAQLMAAGIGVVGALLGVVIERFLRFWGGVWCEPAHHEVGAMGGDPWEGLQTAFDPDDAQWFDYTVRLDLYNSKEVPVGLRNVRLVFEGPSGEEPVVSRDTAELLRRPASGPPEPQMYAPLYAVNLPPRQWVVKELTDRFYEEEEIRRVFGWRRIKLTCERRRVWPLPPKKHSWVVASRPD